MTSSEIEKIVRQVLATLTASDPQSLEKGSGGNLGMDARAVDAGILRMLDRVISVQSLKNNLKGIHRLEILQACVLTPAARDYCGECKIEIIRIADASGVIVSPFGRPQTTAAVQSNANRGDIVVQAVAATTATVESRVIVGGIPTWLTSIATQLKNDSVHVFEPSADDQAALQSLTRALEAKHAFGIGIVQSPHAVCWQMSLSNAFRPAVLANWTELEDVLQEMPVNLLLLSAKSWNAASTCNVARRLLRHQTPSNGK